VRGALPHLPDQAFFNKIWRPLDIELVRPRQLIAQDAYFLFFTLSRHTPLKVPVEL
jgi:hypothetical protein